MARVEIRAARPEDKEDVLAFCVNTWEWGDYIEYVWNEWLQDENGMLVVATVDGKPVGMAHFQMLTPHEAWLEGMRVNAEYRNHGIAKAISDFMLAEAKKRGATVARLITESINAPAIRSLEHGPHMHRVAAYAPYKAGTLAASPKRTYGLETPTLATEADIEDIIDYLNNSNIFPSIGGLYYSGFVAWEITREFIERKVAAQEVYILWRWNRLDGLAMIERREGRMGRFLFIGYIDGTTEAISLIAYAMRGKLPEMGLEQVRINAPDMIMVRDALTGAEYEWEEQIFYTYEREL
ncbi:MAG TPA: GNAT family N-acetyltransferase [Ktedonobacteraceae bacterium]|nr:GNAT family N-acetyltransferase [Ktedonobacteraceae bacterium]